MPWCPTCKTEYRPEMDRCPDCGAALLDGAPEAPEVSRLDKMSSLRADLNTAVGAWAVSVVLIALLIPIDAVTHELGRRGLFALTPLVTAIVGAIFGADRRTKVSARTTAAVWGIPSALLVLLVLSGGSNDALDLTFGIGSAVLPSMFGAVGILVGNKIARRTLLWKDLSLFILGVLGSCVWLHFAERALLISRGLVP